jgi:hypothetical protein
MQDDAAERSRMWLEELLERGLKPHAERLAEIGAKNRFACLIWRIDPKWASRAQKAFGWKPGEDVFALADQVCANLATADLVTRRWVQAGSSLDSVLRILIVSGPCSTLLMNYAPGRGYWIESGSLDAELAKTRS